MHPRSPVLGALTAVLAIAADTPAAASTCVPPSEVLDLELEAVSVDGVDASGPSRRARLGVAFHTLDGKPSSGVAFVSEDGRTEWYESMER